MANIKTIRDPKGNALKPLLLQVLERDEQGPTVLRARRDHETIDISDEKNREFLIVWGAVDSVLGEMRLEDIATELHATKLALEQQRTDLAGLRQGIDQLAREQAALEEENRVKTEALRQLQKERDPERIEQVARERAEAATVALSGALATERAANAQLRREVDELRASKKRLKEANDRLKDRAK